MKLALLTLLLLLAVALVACGNNTAITSEQPTDTMENTAPAEDTVTAPAMDEVPDTATAPEQPVEETEPSLPPTTEPADLDVSQEDLDELKAGIEGISTDDLGGLSE